MSLSGKDKDILIHLHLEKAHQYMTDAEQLLATNSISSAANRLYYSVFHAIHALFVANGITTKSHHGTNSKFHQNFVKTGLLDSRFGQFVGVLEGLREKADYDVVYTVSRVELEAMQPIARELIGQIETLLKN